MLRIQKITDYCSIITYKSQSIMFGCPADIVKILQSINLKSPNTVVIPDDFFQFGTYMACLEFYFYSIIFNSDDDGKKLNIIGSKDAIKRAKIILEQNIEPLSREKLRKWGIEESKIEKYISYSGFLRYNIPKLESRMNFYTFKNHEFKLGEVTIRENFKNNYTAITNEDSYVFDLNLKAPPQPFFAVPKMKAVNDIQSGMVVVGAGNGFSPYEENSGAIVYENYIPIFIDGSQGTKAKLTEYGYRAQDVPIIVLTHLHDDHSNILDLIAEGRKIHLLTLKVVYKGFIEKASATLNISCESIEKSIKFTELEEGKTKRLFGIDFLAHETIHSIPCMGIRINRKILISGDGLWGSKLKEALEKGIIDKNTFAKQQSIPLDKEADIIFMDAGGKAVHPSIEELVQLPNKNKKKLILNHVSINQIPLNSGLKTALSGQSFILKKGWQKIGKEAFNVMLSSPAFKNVSPEWLKTFTSQGHMIEFSEGQKIQRRKDSVFVLISGIIAKSLSTVAPYSKGALIMYGSKELHAMSSGYFLEIDKRLFEEFLNYEGKTKTIKKLEKIESIISHIPSFFRLGQKAILSNMHKINIKKLKKGGIKEVKNCIAVLVGGNLKQIAKTNVPVFFKKEKLLCDEDYAEFITIEPEVISEELSEAYLEGIRKGVIF